MGLIGATSEVFDFFHSVYDLLPVAVRLLIVGVFGSVVFISILRSIRG